MPSKLSLAPNVHSAAKISTEEFARRVLVVPQSVRAGYCRNGHYLGLKPLKLSGRLLWDSAAVERLLAGDIDALKMRNTTNSNSAKTKGVNSDVI